MSAARSRRANDKHNHLQRTPILVMGCSLLIACCIAFGGTNWTASAQPSEDQLPEQNAIVEPGYYQETIGSYEAISQSDDDERAENLRLAAEAINGYVIEPGATFSFNEVVGDTTAERGYKEAPVLYSSGLGSSDGGGICQVSTLNDDVANADDTFALPKGTEITREIALDAKKHDALLLLTMSVD